MIDLSLFYKQNPWQRGKIEDETLIQRTIERSISKWLTEKEIILLKGARQVGKSTLLKQIIKKLAQSRQVPSKNIFYFTFDERSLREAIKNDPQQLFSFVDSIASHNHLTYIFLDEVQKVPLIFEAVKMMYDQGTRYKFFLTGSSMLGLTGNAAKAITGRTIDFTLYPLTIQEIFGFRFPELKDNLRLKERRFSDLILSFESWREREQRISFYRKELEEILAGCFTLGSYPRICTLKETEKKQELLRNIRNDYLEKDIQGMIKKEKFYAFTQLLDLLAFQIGNLINHQELGSGASISYKTLRNFISLLEKTHIVFLLPPLGKGRRNLIKRNPKVYFNDLGIRNVSLSFPQAFPVPGEIPENLIFNSLCWLKSYAGFEHHLYFARTTAGSEVDFIIERGEQIIPVEVKYSPFMRPSVPRALLGFMESLDLPGGIVITKDLLAQRKIRNMDFLFIPLWLWASVI